MPRMEAAAGETQDAALGLVFDRRLKLEFHGSKITSDGGLLACRELDDVLGLSETAGEVLTDTRTGANGRHTLVGQFRQSVFGRLAGYEDVNDADRLAHDPALRWVVGGQAVMGQAASTSQMGRFETEVLTQEANLSALTDLSGRWIDRVHARRPVRGIVLDIDSSVSPTYGEQEGSAYNGHFGSPATILYSCSTSSATWSAARFVPATSTLPRAGATCWSRSWPDTEPRS